MKVPVFFLLAAVLCGAHVLVFRPLFFAPVVHAAGATSPQSAPQATSSTVSGDGGDVRNAMSNMKGSKETDSCGGGFTGDVCSAFKQLLYGMLIACGYVVQLAITIVTSVTDPKIMSIAGRPEIYAMWKVVRDFINLFFILGLLYSAFSTVFQIQDYNLKKKWLTIVIAALLVNFSFPVTRFIIDASNVTGYFMMQQVFGDTNGANMTNRIGGVSNIAELMVGGSGEAPNTSFSYLFMSIVFALAFGVTLLVVAAMFIVRLGLLVVLIIFSPVGFAAGIFPATSQYANDWWKNIFRFSFLFPAMIFMMIIAIKFMVLVGQGDFSGNASNGGVGSMVTPIAIMAYLSIPIIILWVGVFSAAKLGGDAANIVVGQAQRSVKWIRKKAWENKGKALLIGAGAATGGALFATAAAVGGAAAAGGFVGSQRGRTGLRKAFTTRDKDGNLVWRGGVPGVGGKQLGGSYAARLARRGQAKWDSRRSPMYEKAEKEYEAQLNAMSAADREVEIQKMMNTWLSKSFGYKRDVAARVAVKSGSHKNVDIETAKKIGDTLRNSGELDLFNKFRESRPDVRVMATVPASGGITDDVKLKAQQVYQDMIDNDQVKNLTDKQVDNKFVEHVVNTMDPGQMADFASKLPAKVKKSFEEEIRKSLHARNTRANPNGGNTFSDDFVRDARQFGAHISGNAQKYFSNMDTSGNFSGAVTSGGDTMRTFVSGLSPQELKKQSLESLTAVAADSRTTFAFFKSIQSAGLSTNALQSIKSSADPRHTNDFNSDNFWRAI